MRDVELMTDELGRLSRRSRVLDRSPLATVVLSADQVVLDVNAAFSRLVGQPVDDLVGRHVLQLVAPQDRHLVLMEVAARDLGREQGVLTCRLQTADGGQRWTRSSWYIEPVQDGRSYCLTYVEDVEGEARTMLVADEMLAAVEAERAVLNAALEASPDGMAIFQAERDERGLLVDARLLRMNTAGAEGRRVEDLAGRSICEYFPEALATGLHRALLDAFETQESRRLLVEVDETGSWPGAFETVLVPIDSDRVLCSFRDVSRARHAEQQLLHAATHDALTGLPNRVLLRDRLEHALSRVHRDQEAVTIAFLDLDGFKAVNDTWGHTHGDQVLKQVSARLSSCVREGDTVARLGGDEFVLVLEGCADEEAWRRVYARVRSALCEPLQVATTTVSLRASVGVVFVSGDPMDVDAVMRHADDAMYASKNNGKGQYTVLSTQRQAVVDLDLVAAERR